MATNIQQIQQETMNLIDSLKATTSHAGLGGGGNEYTVLVEVFLYKFLNDKFIAEAKRVWPALRDADDIWAYLDAMNDDDYDQMCDLMHGTVELRKNHLIPFLAKHQNEDNFATLFDATFEQIASNNRDVFYIMNADQTSTAILRPISDLITGGTQKKNDFCKSLITNIAGASFEGAFSAGYDFFSTVFEYLIHDYNANGGGTYAEYYTPHAIAMIMAQLLVTPDEDVKNVTCYDPAAGTGTLVIALGHTIGEERCTIYTQDISDKSSTMMMLNLILNNKADSLSHVVQGNTLTIPFHKEKDGTLKKFDYVVSNPPFKLDFSDYQAQLKNDTYKGRFFAGIPNIPKKDKKTMEIYLCFFQHLIYSLNEKGKAAIVVPTGFLTAKSGIPLKIRQHLVDNKILRGVVSMPSNIFANTGTNVSVIFIDKSKKLETVSLVDASKLGTNSKIGGIKKTVLSEEDITKIVDTFRSNRTVEDFSVAVPNSDIESKGYSFSAGQYFDIKIDYVDITEDEFNRRMDNFKATLRQQFSESHRLEEEILKQLDCIGFNENVGKENSNE